MKNRRSFTPEFKRRVIEEYLSRVSTPTQVIRKHNISWNMLGNWKKRSMSGNGFPVSRKRCTIRNGSTPPGVTDLRRNLKTSWIFRNRKPRAAQPGYPDLTVQLQGCTADIKLKNNAVVTPLDLALEECQTMTASYLHYHGARKQ